MEDGFVKCTNISGNEIATFEVPAGRDPYGAWLWGQLRKQEDRSVDIVLVGPTGSILETGTAKCTDTSADEIATPDVAAEKDPRGARFSDEQYKDTTNLAEAAHVGPATSTPEAPTPEAHNANGDSSLRATNRRRC